MDTTNSRLTYACCISFRAKERASEIGHLICRKLVIFGVFQQCPGERGTRFVFSPKYKENTDEVRSDQKKKPSLFCF
jgi:hypothetical protein